MVFLLSIKATYQTKQLSLAAQGRNESVGNNMQETPTNDCMKRSILEVNQTSIGMISPVTELLAHLSM